jgi:hypothetical protein
MFMHVAAIASFAFSPARLPYEALSDAQAFSATARAALEETGMLQVTGIPGFAEGRKEMLARASGCGKWGQTHTFRDGTVRNTMATHTIPGPGGAQRFPGVDGSSSVACAAFEAAAAPFRAAVDESIRLFAAQLTDLLTVEAPLLSTPGGHAFVTLSDVVENGEHLEHVHSYTRPNGELNKGVASEETKTLPMHTDQGLFIAFTPALSHRPDGLDLETGHDDDEGVFEVRLSSGEVARASFDSNALVFMLGEGIRQVVDPKLLPSAPSRFVPRPTPHSLRLPPCKRGAETTTTRLWYGRMVLPPYDALAQGAGGKTHGEIRDAMNRGLVHPADPSNDDDDDDDDDAVVTLGCAPPPSDGAERRRLSSLHRQLMSEPASCNHDGNGNGTGLHCWHRCMSLVEFDATPAQCAAAGNLRLQCVNPRDQITGGGHGDFFPKCTNTTAQETPYPPLVNSPRPSTCDDADAFDAFAGAQAFAASVPLDSSCGGGWGTPGTPCVKGKFMWSVDAADPRIVHVKIAYDGLFGWLAVGLENPGGRHNGMNGGRIVMATPGNAHAYSAVTGLPAGPMVAEYVIAEGSAGSAFRLWSTPYPNASITNAAYEAHECYTSLSFSTSAIAGEDLNHAGANTLIWGANADDTFVGYHGRESRGHLSIAWADGVPASPALTAAEWTAVAIGAAIVGAILGGILVGTVLRKTLRQKPKKESSTEIKSVSVTVNNGVSHA